MRILITLCARGGSKGIPFKNIKKLKGKPLIAYSIKKAFEFKNIYKHTDIGLSTDSQKIKDICSDYGLITDYERPLKLSTDNIGKVETINDLLLFEEKKNKINYDYILDLDISAPLRTINDLIKAFELIKNDTNALNLFSVSDANKNPYFNMVEMKENGYFSLIKERKKKYMNRQSTPIVYDINASFYFYKRVFFKKKLKSIITNRSLIYKCDHISFDIDNELDFEIMEFLITQNKLNFKI